MRRYRHSLEHLSRLPEFARECDISQVRIVSQDVRRHGGKHYAVTTFAVEVWKPQDAEIVTLGSALTALHERKPGQKPPHIVVETSSIKEGFIGIDRLPDEASAMLTIKRKSDALIAGFTTLSAGGDYDPAA